jgi:7-carboxy-7-deazaguanine synthase
MKFRYTEAFYSVQGEGVFVGVPSVFLRMFGCNFQCAGFGMPKGELSEEYKHIVATDYKNFEDLPLVRTGCDSYASWDPRFKHLARDADLDKVVDELLKLTPTGSWTLDNGQDIHLILTGGEPLLGWQRAYTDLFNHPKMKDLKNVTFETNTTQQLRGPFREFLESQEQITWTFSCSPKLSVSGESWDDAIKPQIASEYFNIPNSNLYFKFVVGDEADVQEVERAVQLYRDAGVESPVYIMPVGGCAEEYQSNTRRVAGLAMERGWRYSPRLHVDIFGNSWGT